MIKRPILNNRTSLSRNSLHDHERIFTHGTKSANAAKRAKRLTGWPIYLPHRDFQAVLFGTDTAALLMIITEKDPK